MSRAALIGDALRVEGYALAGAIVYPAANRDEARAAWGSLPPDVAVVVLTPDAAGWLAEELRQRPAVLSAVMRA